ncbi:MAG: alpha/beta fold hydrolase [Solirubrobacterales bacterium]
MESYRERGRTRALAVTIAFGLALLVLPSSAAAQEQEPEASPPGANDFQCEPTEAHPRPVVLLHGLGANMSANWSYNSPRLADAGYCVFALTYGHSEKTMGWPYRPAGLQPMEESSKELKAFVRRVLDATGARRVDLVGHSEGTVMPRYYLERRGGVKFVKRFVALTPLWRGTEVGGAAVIRDIGTELGFSQPVIDAVSQLCASCPQFLRGSDYLNDLNADGEAIPQIKHTNIATRYDELVIPYTSGLMVDGGTNIVLQDVCPMDPNEHSGVAFDPVVTQLFLNALDPRSAKPITC